jgi:hypothetical protein
MLKCLPYLQSGTHTSSRAPVIVSGLYIAGEKLKSLQVMGPNAERAGSGIPTYKVVPRISIRVQFVSLRRDIIIACWTYLITSRMFLFLAKLTAAWTCLTVVALTTKTG